MGLRASATGERSGSYRRAGPGPAGDLRHGSRVAERLLFPLAGGLALGATALASTGAVAATPNHGITNTNSHQSSNAQAPKPSYQGQKKLIGGDPNTWTPEYKAFQVKVEKV